MLADPLAFTFMILLQVIAYLNADMISYKSPSEPVQVWMRERQPNRCCVVCEFSFN